ncbi:unnamed protein product [Effrenium voratum]|uniref:carbonic anhydrase n=4 Tax=Effrenium voratum TaxID=2562239 RepID=A0AA36NMN5_9DINO|nr:unnamed protein product [Effrenium voratum]
MPSVTMVFAQLADAFSFCTSPDVRHVRTTADPPMAPEESLKMLKEGNRRFVDGRPLGARTKDAARRQLVDQGQAPHTAIIGCADSRAPLETIFDAMPGDLFVLRNAGNTCTHAEGSMVGSLEFATGKLGSRLILVLGHTNCGAIAGATKTYLEAKVPQKAGSALQGLLQDLGAVAEQAVQEAGPGASADEVTARAVKVNVYHTMSFLLRFSESIRSAVREGTVQIQGGIYNLETGSVDFLGALPTQTELLDSTMAIPPSMVEAGEARGKHGVRTGADSAVPKDVALKMLKAGNERFAAGAPTATQTSGPMRKALVQCGQAPHSAILGCADSRVPVDTVFDAMPGELFVLRNAGNTCTHAEGSMVGSLEFATGKLGSRLILVLGHTNCGAIAGATKTYLEAKVPQKAGSALQGLLQDLGAVAEQAVQEAGPGASADEVTARAVKVNVYHTMSFLLRFSESIRSAVREGTVQIQGGIYNLETGSVDFLGALPTQTELLDSTMAIPPSMVEAGEARGKHGVRTGADSAVPKDVALKMLKAGNERFAAGAPTATQTSGPMRKALVQCGQAPHSAILGCADSRVPVDTVFDAMPGELFVLRNAGNTCTHAEGSMVGSLEFCTGKLGSRLILVLGHTKCGAIAGATQTFQAGGEKAPGSALEGLLQGLSVVAKEASEELGPGALQEELAAHATKVNVFSSMNFLLKYSEPIRELVRKGDLDIQGGIYHLETGRVEFLGRSPQQAELLAAEGTLPPSMALGTVRTTSDGPMAPQAALKLLKVGNERFVVGAPKAGKVHSSMRETLATGQAPHTALVGCADSRVPLETVFDALPGDLFVLRNAGNTCTHAEGSVLGSLEFCTGPLKTRLIFVLGHTSCGAIKGATSAFLSGQKKKAPQALDALLQGLGSVVSDAQKELGKKATEEQVAAHAVKLNVFHTMNFMLKYSEPIRQKVRSGELEIQGGVYDLQTGRVEFLGASPSQAKLVAAEGAVAPSLKSKMQGA